MNENKKTVLTVGTSENGEGEISSLTGVDLSVANYSMTTSCWQDLPLFLPRGAENAVSSRKLMLMLGIRDIRTLRACVAKNRAAGALILSNTSGGYYLPDAGEKGRREMERFVATVRSKALTHLCAARPVRAALRVLDGQEHLDDYAVKGDNNDG